MKLDVCIHVKLKENTPIMKLMNCIDLKEMLFSTPRPFHY